MGRIIATMNKIQRYYAYPSGHGACAVAELTPAEDGDLIKWEDYVEMEKDMDAKLDFLRSVMESHGIKWTLDDAFPPAIDTARKPNMRIDKNMSYVTKRLLAVCAFRLDPTISVETFIDAVDELARAAWYDGWRNGHGGLGDIDAEWSESETGKAVDE